MNKITYIMGFSPSKPIDFNKISSDILSSKKQISNPIIISYSSKELLYNSIRSRTQTRVNAKTNKEFRFIKSNIEKGIEIIKNKLEYDILEDIIELNKNIDNFINSLDKEFIKQIKLKSEKFVSKTSRSLLDQDENNQRILCSYTYVINEVSYFYKLFHKIKLSGINEIIICYPGEIDWLLNLMIHYWKEFEDMKIYNKSDCGININL
jgi:hypothetical protein